MIVDILDLGMQPIANAFIDSKDVDKESFYRLIATYDTDMYSFSQKNILNPDDMFNSKFFK